MTGFCIETWHFLSSIMLATMWNRIVEPRSVTGLIHGNSVTMKWTRPHYVFSVEVYARNGNSVVTTEQIFCTHFSIHHDYIPGWNAIKAQAQNLWGTASVSKRKPQGKVPMVWTQKNAEVWEVQSVQQRGITLPYTTLSKCRDFWTKIFYFHHYKNCNFSRMN